MCVSSIFSFLQSTKTREYILQRNCLSKDLAPEVLAEKIFAVVPDFNLKDPKAYLTPMCFLAKCDPNDPRAVKPSAGHQSEIYQNLWTLVALLAPVSFILDDDAEIDALIQRITRHARLDTPKPVVGGAIVARFLGCPLDLDHRETIEQSGNWIYTGQKMDGYDMVYTGATPPVGNIDDNNIVEQVARGLAPQLGLGDASASDVKAKLLLLERQRRSYVCLWVNRLLSNDNNTIRSLHIA